MSGHEKTPQTFSKSAALAGTQKRAVSCRHHPFSVLLFTCLRRPVFRCLYKTLILLFFSMFSYGNALKPGGVYYFLLSLIKMQPKSPLTKINRGFAFSMA
ncbi:hypothetical protein D7X25_17430 [bacterium 1XD42-8]|nr:hypothetical protein D7X25_17430 [bacterium 1XD42-8]